MNANNQNMKTAITSIINLFKNEYQSSSGFPIYALNGLTGQCVTSRTLLSELDDYLTFFYMLKEYDYVKRQIDLLQIEVNNDPFIFKTPQIRVSKGLGLPLRKFYPHNDNQDYVEILYALIELYDMSGEIQYLDIFTELLDEIISGFYKDNQLYTWRLRPYGQIIPIADAMSGMYIEILMEAGTITKNHRYIEIANQIKDRWIHSKLFKKYGIFPLIDADKPWSFIPKVNRLMGKAELAKSNSAMGAGLIAMTSFKGKNFEIDGTIQKWVQGLEKCFLTDRGVFAHLPDFSSEYASGPILSTNFAMIDIYCDLYVFYNKEKYLNRAVKIAEFFIEFQHGDTGLFPDNINSYRSYLDGNTDLAVSLYRLSELTQDNRFYDAGYRAINGVIKFHRCKYGYYRDVDIRSGNVINPIVETRFVSLFLKALILYSSDENIYGSEGNWSRFRDR